MKKIYQAADLTEANLLKDRLQQSGLQATVEQQHMSGGFGELPTVYPEVWVLDNDDEALAKQHLMQWLADRDSGFVVQDWQCLDCGEVNPGNFASCWSCQGMPR